MTAIEVWIPGSDQRLADLATTANEEYRLARASVIDALRHAIACGEALNEASSLVPDGQWMEWCKANLTVDHSTGTRWARLAAHKDVILVSGGPETLSAATAYLRDQCLQNTSRRQRTGQHPSFDVDEAKRLRREGKTYKEIGELLGATDSRIGFYLRPGERERAFRRAKSRRQRQRAARAALEAKERDDAIKRVGGDLSVAYASLRKVASVVDQVRGDTDDDDQRKALQTAYDILTKAEALIGDVIVGRDCAERT